MTELEMLIKEQEKDMKYGHLSFPERISTSLIVGEQPCVIASDPHMMAELIELGWTEYDGYHGWHRDDV